MISKKHLATSEITYNLTYPYYTYPATACSLKLSQRFSIF